MLFTRQKKIKHRLKGVILVFLALYLMIGTALYFLQEKILFRPTVLNQTHVFKFSHPFEELFLKADDGAMINALHFKAEKSKGIILYFHGNAGDLSRWGKITEYFVEKGYDVLVMDYRTYGKSTGVLSEQALFNDAQMCYNYVKERYKEDHITVYGRSLGTSMASYVASRNKPKQLILEAPFYNIQDIAKYRFPFFAIYQLLHYKLPTNKFIKNVSCDITIFHGKDDYVVPIKSGEKLFQVAPRNLTTFTIIEKGSHNDLFKFEEYNKKIKEILP
jgi:alpha-beta hydrolase superfamily lysophospholipase